MADHPTHEPHPELASHRHEKTDVRTRVMVLSMIAALFVLAGFMAVIWGLDVLLRRMHDRAAAAPSPLITQRTERYLPPEPRLQADPAFDMAEMLHRQNDMLKTYGWVDRSRGIVRIPIDRATELALTRGFLPRTNVLITTVTTPVERPVRPLTNPGPPPGAQPER